MSRKFRVPVPPPPKKKYSLKVVEKNIDLEVDPEKIPYDRHGLPGSVLDRVCADNEELIEHACGGVQACSTCHIYVTKGLETCPPASEREEDYLDKARGVKTNSRLACCVVPDGTKDVEIAVPKWNVNLVKEGH
jgi:2Fe-2S ferredoxin